MTDHDPTFPPVRPLDLTPEEARIWDAAAASLCVPPEAYKATLVPIAKRFDAEGRPTCKGCIFQCSGDYQSCCANADRYYEPGPTCPVHFPQPDQEPL